MQPVKLTIWGRFWDSQLYKGRLYLFDLDGSLRELDWNALVESFAVPPRCRLALECAFQRSDFLYGNKWDKFYKDAEVSALLQSKFDELLRQTLEVDAQLLDRLTEDQVNTPFPFAHNESLVYKDQLYATSQSGVFAQPVYENGGLHAPVSKLWDAPVSGMDINLDVLALAAGDHGLYRAPTAPYYEELTRTRNGPEQVWQHLCNDCSYISSSILAFGYDSGASLVEFRSPKQTTETTDKELVEEFWKSKPLGFVEGRDIFRQGTEQAFIWGSKNRMCMAQRGMLHVTQYMTTNPRRKSVSKEVRSIQLAQWKGNPVSGDNAVFGAILELDNCLVVVRSDDQIDTLPGEPTNWRVFPRSKFYVNQMHVIYDDRVEILSYNHDYFVNQGNKAFGEPHIERKFFRGER